ncbi:MAG: peptidylprolyl isomerase [bacterium]
MKKITLFIILFLILCCLKIESKEIPLSQVVITVNETKFTYAQYKMAFDYHRDLYKQKYGKFPQEWEEALKNIVIEGLIRDALLSQEAEKVIKVTEKELDESIKKSPQFKDAKGKFDETKYRLALANPEIDWSKIYERQRKILMRTKLEERIKNAVKVSEEEIRKEFCTINEKIRIRYVLIKFEEDKIDAGTITDTEIEDYYRRHLTDYQQPEQVRARHILIKPENNKKEAKAKIEDILKEIKAGGSFEELAMKYSACPSKNQGGDLNFFSRGQMVKPFEDAAFNLKLGEISDIVETQFGFHIIKLEDKRQARTIPLSEASEGIKNTIHHQKIRQEAEKIAKSKTDEIYSKITQGFGTVATEYSLEIKETESFGHQQPVSELGYFPEIEEIFNLKQDQISQPIKIWSGFLIAQLIEKQIDEIKYSKEKEKIRQDILKKKKEMALDDWYKKKKLSAKITINL